MRKQRVRFYSDTNLNIYLERSNEVLSQFTHEFPYNDINDIIELFNIKRYFDVEMVPSTWTAKEITSYKAKIKQFPSVIGKYLGMLSDENILTYINSVNLQYSTDFWDMLNEYKVYKRVSPNAFRKVLQSKKTLLRNVLRNEQIVQNFKDEIKEQLMSSPEHAILLIENYLEAHDSRWQALHFPDCLSNEDKEALTLAYINSTEAHLNLLGLISTSQSSIEFPLSDKTILTALKRHQEEIHIHFANSPGIECSVEVSFSEKQTEPALEEMIGLSSRASYSSIWIKENLDYPTLLNNFIYLFGYVDRCFRCQFVHNRHYLGVFEQLAGAHGKREYYTGVGFNQISMLNSYQIIAYDQELRRNNIDLLDVFKWFFEVYLLQEFGVQEFRFNTPTKNTTYFEKCRFITSELDSILKQFKLYVEFGTIDHELLQISSNHLLVKDVPSMIKKKYLYPDGDDYQKITYCIFSDQCMLAYVEGKQDSYESFFDIIRAEQIQTNDYTFERPTLDWLIEQGYIKVNSAGFLEIASDEVYVYRDLYLNDVTCPSYLPSFKSVICNIVEKENARYSSTLFSEPERDYLNYILNRSQFSNGLDLRNRYSHGTQPAASDENAHYLNYYVFLKIIALIVIKINEEFYLLDHKPTK